MAKSSKPLAVIVQPDVPEDATALLEAMGHCLYAPQRAAEAGVKIDAVVGAKCWRMPTEWWLGKDGKLSAHAKMMLAAATTAAYPDAKPKAKGRKR